MHSSSMELMKFFIETYIPKTSDKKLVLDIGSMNVNGTYKDLLSPEMSCEYIGLDMSPGDNVDLVVDNPYFWENIASESVDFLITGQTFEHIKFFWKTMEEIKRVLKKGGYCFIIAPSTGPVHRYPVDCWRFYADGMQALAEYVNFEVIKSGVQQGGMWNDAYLAAKKPA